MRLNANCLLSAELALVVSRHVVPTELVFCMLYRNAKSNCRIEHDDQIAFNLGLSSLEKWFLEAINDFRGCGYGDFEILTQIEYPLLPFPL